MQIRIKVVTRGDNSKIYYPQYKGWIFWHSYQICDMYYSYSKYYTSLKEAIEYLDYMIEYEKRQTTKDITYIKYP